ncbi:MAG: hypothetical protein ACYCPW_00860 [Nitrososphaerales archaeon]
MKQKDSPECIGCGKKLSEPYEKNKMGDEFICDPCRDEMMSSLEGAWKKHSAFLDSALN